MNLIQKIFTKEKLKEAWPLFLIALVIIVLDQWSKIYVSTNFRIHESVQVIPGFLKFTYVHNKGAAFSFGSMFNDSVRLVLFKILPIIIGAVLVRLIFSDKESKLLKYAYALILGGGTGNVIDRIRLDYVVDFISVYHTGFELASFKFDPWYFAIFNIADSAVTIAAGILILDFILHRHKEKMESQSSQTEIN